MEYLGDLPSGMPACFASAVSADGSKIVGNYRAQDYSTAEAFLWDNGVIVGLGDFPGGAFFSEARDISSDGSVVVGSGIDEMGYRAFIWDEVNGMQDLNLVLTEDYGLDLGGWTLESALSISSDGTLIIGRASGESQFWIAEIPEPCTLLLLGLGVVLMKKR